MEELVRVVRPMFDESRQKDLNIIGIFKIVHKDKTSVCDKEEFTKTNDCFVTKSNEGFITKSNDCFVTKSNRNEGFTILSDRNNVSSHLRKTKFCKIKITSGCCTRSVCNFAHNMVEYHFAECAFKNNCKKEGCYFKHPSEKLDEYKNRINFKIPTNIN